ncbi:MAG: hypothetical protein VCA36_10920, partial [Opitutales bacterium]
MKKPSNPSHSWTQLAFASTAMLMMASSCVSSGTRKESPSPAPAVPAENTQVGPGHDWLHWRGPNGDGVSTETGLPDKLDLNGSSLLW